MGAMTPFLDPDFHLIPLPADGGPARNVISSATVYPSAAEAFGALASVLERVDCTLIVLPMVVCTVPDITTLRATGQHTVAGYRLTSLGGLDPVLASLQAQALREASAVAASGVPGGL